MTLSALQPLRDPAAPARPAPHRAALAAGLALAAAAILATVWAIQLAGYPPCDLCLIERLPFYLAVPVGVVTAVLARRGAGGLARVGFAILAALFVVSLGLAANHAGVEFKWWAGPSDCTGAPPRATDVKDFLAQLKTVKVVRCDEPALTVVGLSLAGWNVLVSAVLAGLAGWGATRRA